MEAALLAEGHRLVLERLAAGVAPGRYQILAAIHAVHTSARRPGDTDWSQSSPGMNSSCGSIRHPSSLSTALTRSPWGPATEHKIDDIGLMLDGVSTLGFVH